MTRAYRRIARPTLPGIELSEHDNLSRALYVMRQQAVGIRRALKAATGRGSPPSQAATALVEAVRSLQQALLAEVETAYGQDTPAAIRTRYS